MNRWEEKAHFVEKEYGAYVDWYHRFYICPHCEAAIYDSPLLAHFLKTKYLCPICNEI